MDSELKNANKNYSLVFQIIIAIIFGFLNLVTCYFLTDVLKIPLFLDMIFIYAAGFFGLVSGFVCSVVFSISSLLFFSDSNIHDKLPYIICMFTGVLVLRFFIRKADGIKWTTLLLTSLVSTILISIEGGIIYTLLFSEFSSQSFTPTIYMIYQLILSDVPFLAAAILARVPVNLADKLIAVFAGCGVFVLTKRMRWNILKSKK